jgi:hypothetical protein
MSVLEIKRRPLCLVADRVRPRTLLDCLGSHAPRTEKNMITLILLGLFLSGLFGLFAMFLVHTVALWSKSWRGPRRRMIASERYAMDSWWCPARRNRIATSGVSGFNLTIFPVQTQWRRAFINWLFPYYFWSTAGRHGMCQGSACAVWRWHRDPLRHEGWCGLADAPHR